MHLLYLTCTASVKYLKYPAAFILLLLFSLSTKAQRKQLTPSNKVVKIAYIDHLALRKQYQAFNDRKKNLADESVAERKSNKQANTTQLLERQKLRNQQRIFLMQDYEKKIQLAIESVVMEGGFTDVQPIDKNTSIINGKNITDLVLKKLN